MTSPKIAVRSVRADPAMAAPTTTASATPARAGFTAGGSLRRQFRVGRRLEDPEHVERPVPEPGAPDDLRLRYGAEGPRILRVGPVVAHQEEIASGDDPAVFV